MIRASIDIGSNSILLLIADIQNNSIVKVLENESSVTGLGRDLDKNGKFLDVSMEESLEVFKRYSEIINKYDITSDNIIVTATEASRVASNASSFFKEVKSQTNLDINIITGEAEAYYSTKGILLGTDKKDIVIMDIGGASTELIKYSNDSIQLSFSMPVGAVRLTNWMSEKVEESKTDDVFRSFHNELEKLKNVPELYCVAGTMTSVANMHLKNKNFDEKQVHGHQMSVSDLIKMYQDHESFDSTEFLVKFPFLGKRSKTIRAGLYLANKICKKLNVEEVEVSTYGLRYGTLLEGRIHNEFIFNK